MIWVMYEFNWNQKIPQCGIQDFPVLLTFSFYWTALQLGAHMATCLDFPIIPSQSFFVVFDLFVVVFVLHARMPQ
jgi:hypothetical protein